jgi:hypothetical protein
MIPVYKYTHKRSTSYLHSPPPGGASASESDPKKTSYGKPQRVRMLNRETVPTTMKSGSGYPWRFLDQLLFRFLIFTIRLHI